VLESELGVTGLRHKGSFHLASKGDAGGFSNIQQLCSLSFSDQEFTALGEKYSHRIPVIVGSKLLTINFNLYLT